MKLFQEPIDVQVRDGLPTALEWRGCVYRVLQILQEWTWRGRWWTDAMLRGESRHYYRVTCTPSACVARARPRRAVPRAHPITSSASLDAHRRQAPSTEPTASSTCLDIYERSERWVLSRVLD